LEGRLNLIHQGIKVVTGGFLRKLNVQRQGGLGENSVGDILKWVDKPTHGTGVHLTSSQIEISRWTAEEFERLVLESKPRVAVFDCDGTLWNGDAGGKFLKWSIEQGLVSRSTSDWIDTRYRAYLAGERSEEQICGEVVQIYAGLRDEELREAAARFMQEFVPKHIFAEMVVLVEALQRAGTEIWAVSSTNKWVIAEGVRPFGIPEERVLAVELRVEDGLITSELVDVPSGEGKAAALKRVGLPHPDAIFGNSIHDLAMLEMARNPFPVNPSPTLLKEVARRGWGYFMPQAATGEAVGGE
jgi:phosphoserine phosphatase